MNRTILILSIVLLSALPAGRAQAGGERAMVQERAEYLSERGVVLPAHEVRIEDLLSGFDFQYPEPEGNVGISLYSANKLLPIHAGPQIMMIGVQGKRFGMEELAPLDITLTVDKSGSMAEPDKMDWVKESLEILIDTLRDDDRLCLTVFDDRGSVLLPPTRVGDGDFRERFRSTAAGITPGGGSDLTAGLRTALEAATGVSAEEVPDIAAAGQPHASARRVYLLTDGWGQAKGLMEVLALYKERGIAVTTVGYGLRCDATVVQVITESTEGSSRFIPNREKMEEVFGSGLGRTSVALAKDIRITVELPNSSYPSTWGFNYRVDRWTGDAITYTIPTLHSGDYETILIVTNPLQSNRINKDALAGVIRKYGEESWEFLRQKYGMVEFQKLARLNATYRDMEGNEHTVAPLELEIQYSLMDNPLSGPSDSRVLLASDLLTYSQLLGEVARMGRYYYGSPHSFFFKTWDVRKRLIDTSRRLAYNGFRDEISVLDNYLHILGEQMGLKESTVNLLISDDELIPLVANRPLDLHLENLFHEMYLSLETKPPGNIAVADFEMLSGRQAAMPIYLDEAAGVWLSRLLEGGFRIVERRNLDAVLKEQELALSDLGDEKNAARVGMFLAANYVLTGAVMEMEESVVIFSRLINVETAVIETAAQVIVPKEDIAPQLL